MEHPHIAAVLDAGATECGHLYFVMERIEGAPVTEYCDARRLGIEERTGLFLQVCDAVQHAHRKGLIHRDLKPSNLLVAEVDGRPAPKVIDFGIAKALHGEAGGVDPGLTRTAEGQIFGTPQYMSPEQAGSRRDVDVRSDVYSLGIVLHELLTGETPLDGRSIREAAPDTVLRRIREEEVPRPSGRMQHSRGGEAKPDGSTRAEQAATLRSVTASRLCKLLQGELDWIVLKALEKDRERRYQSVDEFAADLRKHLAGEVVSASPPSTFYRVRKLARRNRRALFGAAAVLLALLAGLALTSWQAVRATTAERIAQSRLEMAEQARDAAERMLEMTVSEGRRAISVGGVTAITESLAGAAEYLETLPEGLESRTTARHRIYVGLGRVADAAFEGRLEEAKAQIEALLSLVEVFESEEPLGEQEEIDLNTALMVGAFAFAEGVDFEESSRLRRLARARSEAWLKAHPEAPWALAALSHEAATAALDAALVTRNPQSALGDITRLKLLELRLARKAPGSVEHLQARGLSLFSEAFASHHLGRDPARVIDLFEDAAAAFRLAYDKEDGHPYRELFFRDFQLGAETAAGQRLLDLGREHGDRAKLERGRDLILDAFSQRLELARADPKRLEWWKDLAGSCKQLVKAAEFTEDKAESEKLVALAVETSRLFPSQAIDHPRTAKVLCEALINALRWESYRSHPWTPERAESLHLALEAWRRSAAAQPDAYNLAKDLDNLIDQTVRALLALATEETEQGPETGWGSDLHRRLEEMHASLDDDAAEHPANPALACAHANLGLAMRRRLDKSEEEEIRHLAHFDPILEVAWRMHREGSGHDPFLAGMLAAAAEDVRLWLGSRPSSRRESRAAEVKARFSDLVAALDESAAAHPDRSSSQIPAWSAWSLLASAEEWIDLEAADRANRNLIRLQKAAETAAKDREDELRIFNTILGPHWNAMDRWGRRLWRDGREEEALVAFEEVVRTRARQRQRTDGTPYHFATLALFQARCAHLLASLGREEESSKFIGDARAAIASAAFVGPQSTDAARSEILAHALDLLEASLPSGAGRTGDGAAADLSSLAAKQAALPSPPVSVYVRELVDHGWARYAESRGGALRPEQRGTLLRVWSEAREVFLDANPSSSMRSALTPLPEVAELREDGTGG